MRKQETTYRSRYAVSCFVYSSRDGRDTDGLGVRIVVFDIVSVLYPFLSGVCQDGLV